MTKIIKNLIIFVSALTAGLMLSFGSFILKTDFSVVKQPSSVLTASLTTFTPLAPPHINLFDFYKTYGQRMLGNSNLKIISREEWGADNFKNFPSQTFCQTQFCIEEDYDPRTSFATTEYLRSRELIINYKNNLKNYDDTFLLSKQQENGLTYYYLPAEEIIIHHTAGAFTNFEQSEKKGSAEQGEAGSYDLLESKKELQRIYKMQAIDRKWRDVAYHFFIDGAGNIFEGTLGGKYSIGAHTYWHNNGTIGIALMGDFRSGHNTLTEPMKESLIKLVKYLVQEYHWDITNQNFYLKKPDLSGREWSTLLIKGHQELDIREIKTECPGINLEQLRQTIYPFIFESAS